MKLLILDGDSLDSKIYLKNKFLFIITEQSKKTVYHIDSTDGNMWKSDANGKNLSIAHRRILKKEIFRGK